MSDTLTALDATFLELEQQDEGALMSIGGVLVFDPLPEGGAPTVEEVCANLASRLHQLPRYSQRLSSPRTGGFAWPRWIDDERFLLRDHVAHVALPAPGGGADLCEWAADFYSHRLDRRRPLWEVALVEGLAGGRWALAHKTHHCLVDGVGSVDLAYLLLDAEPSPPERPPAPSSAPDNDWLLRSFVPGPPLPIAQWRRPGRMPPELGYTPRFIRAKRSSGRARSDLEFAEQVPDQRDVALVAEHDRAWDADHGASSGGEDQPRVRQTGARGRAHVVPSGRNRLEPRLVVMSSQVAGDRPQVIAPRR